MAKHVVENATLTCSFGAAPSALGMLPPHGMKNVGMNAANIGDHVPMTNIRPFGLCSAPLNPQVAAATTAALGVLTPQPCIPNTPSPWIPGCPSVILKGLPALNDTSKLTCVYMGIISVTQPGQPAETIP